jgi:hypothetical protein
MASQSLTVLSAPSNPVCGSDAADTLSRIHAVLGAVHRQREVVNGIVVDGASFGDELIHAAVCDAVRFAAEQVEQRERRRKRAAARRTGRVQRVAEKPGDRIAGLTYCTCPPRSVVTFQELVAAICPHRKRGQRTAVGDWLRKRSVRYFVSERGEPWTIVSALEDALGRGSQRTARVNLEPPPPQPRGWHARKGR